MAHEQTPHIARILSLLRDAITEDNDDDDEYLLKDRLSYLSNDRYMLFQMVHSCKKHANRQKGILVHVEKFCLLI